MTANYYENHLVEQQKEVPCKEFSALGFVSHGSQDASDSASSVSASSNLSGWGSVVSRKSYACLQTLVKEEGDRDQIASRQSRRKQNEVHSGPSWGYFVDTPEI